MKLPRRLGVSLAAEGIQCDSHLPGTSSAWLHSQPVSKTAKQASQLQAPLHLQLQVCILAGLRKSFLLTAEIAWCSLHRQASDLLKDFMYIYKG